MIIPIDASYLYFFVVRKQHRQPLVNNIQVSIHVDCPHNEYEYE